jgi:hypothetical protein
MVIITAITTSTDGNNNGDNNIHNDDTNDNDNKNNDNNRGWTIAYSSFSHYYFFSFFFFFLFFFFFFLGSDWANDSAGPDQVDPARSNWAQPTRGSGRIGLQTGEIRPELSSPTRYQATVVSHFPPRRRAYGRPRRRPFAGATLPRGFSGAEKSLEVSK